MTAQSNLQLDVSLFDSSQLSASSKVASIIYNILKKTLIRSQENSFTKPIWWNFWNKSCETFTCPISTKLHGYDVILNYGYTYPIYSRLFTSYNNPLVELVYQAYSANNNSQVTLIDIGAAIGDTVLLIHSSCPNMVSNYYCLDGDKEFFNYLQYNLNFLSEAIPVFTMLSDGDKSEKELIRTHKGTASSQGTVEVEARPLDAVMQEVNVKSIDIIKIDVDGFDGKVISGSKQILEAHKPAIIFEWHPILTERTNNCLLEPFQVLSSCGYNKFVWFTKYGEFSHFTDGSDLESINKLANLCIRDKFHPDWHYDVVALHQSSSIDPIGLAEASFAKSNKSRA